ncbi:MAG: pyridoxamine 5'-phosphate oxidase family protein [Blastocatellia bacterium]|nr:pyridoxamine 5'-phosphate oxidase family protein [Blastocatellia bacterium]
MIEIEEMAPHETHDLLRRVGFGHLGCARDNRPYVVPIHYAYDDADFYIFTTEGMKTEFISTNLEVCLQVEEVHDPANWRSVVVTGKAELLTKQEDTERAMQYITETNPTLTPAINQTWIDAWGRATKVAIYRIHPSIISGRKTLPFGETRGPDATADSR